MLSAIPKLLAILSRRARIQLVLILLLVMGSAMLEAVGIASIMPFMALVVSPEAIETNRWLAELYQRLNFESHRSFLIFTGSTVLALLVVTNLTKTLSTWVITRFQYRQLFALRLRVLASYMVRPYAFYLGRNTSELGSTILNETGNAIERVLRPFVDIASNGFVCLAVLSLLLVVDPMVAVGVVVVIGGAYVSIYVMIERKLSRIGKEQIEAYALMLRTALEAMSGIKDVKVLGREQSFLDRFSAHAWRQSTNNVSLGVISQLPRYLLEIVAFGGILLVVLFLIAQGKGADLIVPVLAMYAFAGYRLLPMLNGMYIAFAVARFGISSVNLLHTEITSGQHPVAEVERVLQQRAKQPPVAFTQSLELRDIAFRYDGAMGHALKSLNMTVRPNTSIALVGPTGCGKTTTVDLMLGLLDPGAGKILVDGVEITEANRAGWQKIIGYVPQHIYISDDTMARNIAFGIREGQVDMDAVRRAARIANLADLIESTLPEGYDTQIGERGVRLSGGQRQRIGIARALYHDPQILIMDEATSALDGVTEDSVMDAMRSLSRQKTVILIAHRLRTVRHCDVIYQLDGGAVVAQGTYDELMQQSNWFRSAAGGVEEKTGTD